MIKNAMSQSGVKDPTRYCQNSFDIKKNMFTIQCCHWTLLSGQNLYTQYIIDDVLVYYNTRTTSTLSWHSSGKPSGKARQVLYPVHTASSLNLQFLSALSVPLISAYRIGLPHQRAEPKCRHRSHPVYAYLAGQS